ncbi:OLC1v1039055C1 [Oldenlandia corymbosa var. corymbosa]|uniref:OLC1v1039055C1 n=1 Tax=Oldenlandia corymbosa var. corymbosa TaxID=529605 RepID=A0AAV1D1P4_OLDCO|nr:OLC1v1039055C1 [Oldenlandia corymbosa var. corymbosa]
MESPEEAKLQCFLQWLEVNGVQLRGCKIKYSDSCKGFGIFSASSVPDGILLVVPLHLAITAMRVLQDPLCGPACSALRDEGLLDDRLLIILFLTVERLRKNSLWKPYLDMLPNTFTNSLWFSDNELLELRGTPLYRATELQKKNLLALFNEKVKKLADKLLIDDGQLESDVTFSDFLWANSVFWSRAQNIPLPHLYAFPDTQENQDATISSNSGENGRSDSHVSKPQTFEDGTQVAGQQGETVWVEGIVPGIDFCNHDCKALATWEVDGMGSMTGVSCSMYLFSAGQNPFEKETEISISYGNKGNEELLYLYGFVMKNNPDDYLMVNYPVDAIQNVAFSEQKEQLLEAQKAELRCLLPRSLLDHGFFPPSITQGEKDDKCKAAPASSYSWSGHRKSPSYLNTLVFPDDFLTALRTIAMKENELYQVVSLLEELVGPEGKRQPSEAEVRAAVWEVCGDSGGLQLLVDLLNIKLMDLEESSGTEESDVELLKKAQGSEVPEDCKRP